MALPANANELWTPCCLYVVSAVVKKFSTVPQLHKRMEQKNVTSEGMSLLTVSRSRGRFSSFSSRYETQLQSTLLTGTRNFTQGLLTLVPAKRLTATTALAHPYYTNHGDDKSKVVKVTLQVKLFLLDDSIDVFCPV